MRVALVLYGKVGAFDRGTPYRTVDGAPPALDLLTLAWVGVARYVLAANRQAGTMVDVIGHSWSPEIGEALDDLFKLRHSLHEEGDRTRNARMCERLAADLKGWLRTAGFSPPAQAFKRSGRENSCERTASHLLGISRAIQLKAQVERREGFVYDAVLVSRWDVCWLTPILFGVRTYAPGTFYLPEGCVATPSLDTPAHDAFRADVCGMGGRVAGPSWQASAALASPGQSSKAAVERSPPSHLHPQAMDIFALDWWFLSSSADADRFGAEAGSEGRFSNHTMRIAQRLSNHRAADSQQLVYGHLLWGAAMIWGLQARLRFVYHQGVDFALARHWERTSCLALSHGKCRDPLSCSHVDVRRGPWQREPLSSQPPPPRASAHFRQGARHSGMAHACSEGYFFCRRGSRMCEEEQKLSAPFERHEARAVYFACSARV